MAIIFEIGHMFTLHTVTCMLPKPCDQPILVAVPSGMSSIVTSKYQPPLFTPE